MTGSCMFSRAVQGFEFIRLCMVDGVSCTRRVWEDPAVWLKCDDYVLNLKDPERVFRLDAARRKDFGPREAKFQIIDDEREVVVE